MILIKDERLLQTLTDFLGNHTLAVSLVRQDLLNKTLKYWLRSFNSILFKKVSAEERQELK